MKKITVLFLLIVFVMLPVLSFSLSAKDLDQAISETEQAASNFAPVYLSQIAEAEKSQAESLRGIDFTLRTMLTITVISILAGSVIVISNNAK